MTVEVNFDGIVGPTHNYSGLSYGNLPSIENQFSTSNPKEAALQGLEKMKFLASMGSKQGVFPPHERPHLPTLHALGFQGTDAGVVAQAYQHEPHLLLACSSAAAMWTANAATVSPSSDTIDNHLHFTPANLSSKFHRSIEAGMTEKILKTIFKDHLYFRHHPALPPGMNFADEGAANQMRFCKNEGDPGVQVFVFGRYSFQPNANAPKIFPARQTYEASRALARLHQLYPERVIFTQQNPLSIDAGAFHNDVVAVSNRHVLFYHEHAFVQGDELARELERKMAEHCDVEMFFLEVKESQVPLKDAVASYLFNSQLLSLPEGNMILIAPSQCQEVRSVQVYLDDLIKSPNPIARVHYFNLQQSMQNGGGPACLRLRVVMNENELAAANPNVWMNDKLYAKLTSWVEKYYRDRFHPDDLRDPMLIEETQQALNDLTNILDLGNIYSFQK